MTLVHERKLPKNVVISSVFAVLATVFFVINDATIKFLSIQDIKFYHFIFYGTPAYLVMPIYLLVSGQFKTKMVASNYLIPITRGLIYVPMPFLSFWALKYVSLPEFTTLTMAAPIFSLIFSIFLLKERINIFLTLSLCFGALGVLLVTKPGFETFNIFFLVVLFNAFLISLTTLLVNKYEAIISSEGYFVFGGLFVHGFAVILFVFDPRFFDYKTLSLMILASIFVNIAIFLLVVAFQKAQSFYASVSCLNYLQILWSVFFGVILFEQLLDVVSIVGALFIILSGVISLLAQSLQVKKSAR